MYSGVINEVIDQVRDSFLDEGIDESVLSDLKMLWKRKLEESKALEEHKSPEQVNKMAREFNFNEFEWFLGNIYVNAAK